MSFQIFVLLSVVSLTGAFPRSAFQRDFHRLIAKDLESSGNGPDEPIRGSVRVVKLNPHFLRRAAGSHVPSRNLQSRGAFPAFLALGRPGPSVLTHGKPAGPLPQVSTSSSADTRRKQGLEMWKKAMHKSERSKEDVALRVNPKDLSKQSCAAVPFTQRITEEGCETVTVHNHMCYGQCSSMFVPSGGESRGQQRAPCTRCGPFKSRSVLVHLRCGTEVRERRVMIVEECKCETSSEEIKVQNTELFHL